MLCNTTMPIEIACSRCKKCTDPGSFVGKGGKTLKMCQPCRTSKYASNKKAQEAYPGGTVRDGKIKCSHCPRWCTPDSYVGKNGAIVKRCDTCRQINAIQDAKPVRREYHNELNRDKKYYRTSREKKRTEDEAGYLARNAASMSAWVSKNKDHLKKWRTNNVASRLGGIRQQASKKGFEWSLTDVEAETMMRSPCFYCGFRSNETLNGIDRMDNDVGYVPENCVACCGTCNFMKTCLDAKTFVERCGHISFHHNGLGNPCDPEAWRDVKAATPYSGADTAAKRRGYDFDLTRDEFDRIRTGRCMYCGRLNSSTHQNGIDRFINSIGYVRDNCVACCGECNHMKGSLSYHAFVQKCRDITTMGHGTRDFPVMPRCTSTVSQRRVE